MENYQMAVVNALSLDARIRTVIMMDCGQAAENAGKMRVKIQWRAHDGGCTTGEVSSRWAVPGGLRVWN